MQIIPLGADRMAQAAALWNTSAGVETPYKPLNEQDFENKFLTPLEGVTKIALAALEGDRLVGLGFGTRRAGATIGYVTFVLVAADCRRRGVGAALLRAVENAVAAVEPNLAQLEARFFNPVTLEWVVPGTDGHDHPNSPGVDVAGPGYLFLKNNGYRDVDYENSYYRPLAGYEYLPAIAQRMADLAAEGIEITLYDPKKHHGLEELMDDLGSDDWRDRVLGNAAQANPLPLPIVADGDRVCGFAGPIDVQPSGRGYFAGIGVHSAYRQRGCGKALFSGLCMGLKDIGASFMTLFTGESNPARNIYESAGFRIVRSWVGMRKTLQKG